MTQNDRSPYESTPYRMDLIENLGITRPQGDRLKFPMTQKLPESSLEVLLEDPATREFEDFSTNPEYAKASWFFTDETHPLPNAVLINKEGELSDKDSKIITPTTLPVAAPRTAEQKLNQFRLGIGASSPYDSAFQGSGGGFGNWLLKDQGALATTARVIASGGALAAPLGKYDHPRGLEMPFIEDAMFSGSRLPWKDRLDRQLKTPNTPFAVEPTTPNGQPIEALQTLILLNAQFDLNTPNTSKSGLSTAVLDKAIGGYEIGWGHHIVLGKNSPSRIVLKQSRFSPTKVMLYYPEGESEPFVKLPLSKSDAEALWRQDWFKHAQPVFDNLQLNDYWLTQEASFALSQLSIHLGKEEGMKIAEALATNKLELFDSLPRKFDMATAVDGSSVYEPYDSIKVQTWINELIHSVEYNSY